MTVVVVVAAGVVVGAAIALVVLLVVARAVRTGRQRRRAQERAGLRPLLIEVLAGDRDTAAVRRLNREEASLFQTLAIEFLTKVRGEGRDRLAAFFVETGAVAEAERRCLRSGVSARAAAVDFLGTVGSDTSADTIRPLLNDRSFLVRTAAVRTLGRMGTPADVPRLLAGLDGERSVPFATVADALTQIGPAAILRLRDGLRAPNVLARAACAEVLGLLGAVDAVEDLLAHLHPVEDDEVRMRCARALGRIGTPRALLPLTRLVSPSEPPGVRAVAVQSLGRLGGRRATAALAPRLDDDDHRVARNAAAALIVLGDAGLEALRDRAARPGRGAAYARQALARASTQSGSAPTTELQRRAAEP
ncbi:MAG: HEAT repeat domain-containing protein [Acidimicrobiales bacterium]